MPAGPRNTTDAPETGPVRRTWRRGRAAFVRWGPVAVPLLYLAAVLWAQPGDHMGPPDRAPWLGQCFYDDLDVSAMALRGLNASLGRVAGREDNPPRLHDDGALPVLGASTVGSLGSPLGQGPLLTASALVPGRADDEYARALDADLPLQPRYYLEYPHAALLIFRAGYLLQSPLPPVPAAVQDGGYGAIVAHPPRNERERDLWRRFRYVTRVHRCLMAGCLLAYLAVLRAGYQRGGGLASSGVLLVLPAALFFTLHRFDIVPVLLTALSLACLG